MEKAGDIGKLCCPPYDIISDSEREGFIKENPYNIIRLELPKGENPYEEAKETLNSWLEKGILKRDEKPAIYVYEEEFDHKGKRVCIKGLILCLKLEEFSKGIVLPHEFTLSKAKEDRLNLMKATNCNFSQIYGLYIDDTHTTMNTIEKKTKEMECQEFTDGQGITHRLWTVTSPSVIEKIVSDFKDRKIYIADGHHRTAAAALVGEEKRRQNPNHNGTEEYNYFMAVVFPESHLKIIDYNRVVKDLNGMTPEQFLDKLGADFEIKDMGTEIYKPKNLHNFSMYLGGHWYSLTAKKGTYDDNDPIGCLDVTICSNLIFDKLLDIKDLRTSKRIDFVGGIRGLGELKKRVDSGEMAAAFALYPVSMKQLIRIADTGNIMPPKTTWFEPKLRSGLAIRRTTGLTCLC